MKSKILLAALFLPLSLIGCSSDVAKTNPEVKPKKVVAKKQIKKQVAAAKAKAADNATSTYALDDGTSTFKVEPIAPPVFQGQYTTPVPGQQGVPVAPVENTAQMPATAPISNGQSTASASQTSPGATVLVTPSTTTVAMVTPTPLAISIEDAAMPVGTGPAVVALVNQADASQKRGDLDAAVVNLERALRIDSRNPVITYRLAQLRLKQSKPQLAEDLAGKAALLAGSDLDLKRKSWLLIAEARQNLQNYQGAKEAKLKAESFFGR